MAGLPRNFGDWFQNSMGDLVAIALAWPSMGSSLIWNEAFHSLTNVVEMLTAGNIPQFEREKLADRLLASPTVAKLNNQLNELKEKATAEAKEYEKWRRGPAHQLANRLATFLTLGIYSPTRKEEREFEEAMNAVDEKTKELENAIDLETKRVENDMRQIEGLVKL